MIVIPVTKDEVRMTIGLLTYLQNGWCRGYECVIAGDADLGPHEVWKILRLAKPAFADVQVIQPPFRVEQRHTPNWLINAVVMRYTKRRLHDLCVIPPSCVPVQPSWRICLDVGEKTQKLVPVPLCRPIRLWLRIISGKNQWYERTTTKGVLHLDDTQVVKDPKDWHNPECPKVGFLCGAPVRRYLEGLVRITHLVVKDPDITVRRWAAIGDVIAATSIARKLVEAGRSVRLVTLGVCAEAILHCPYLTEVVEAAPAQIDLDLAYENHPQKAWRHINDLYAEAANRQMPGLNIVAANYAPLLHVTPVELEGAHRSMKIYPRPWIVVCPRSNMAARSIPAKIVQETSNGLTGTLFWCSDCPAPPGTVDLKVRTIRNLMAYIAMADLVWSVDSAPLHIAAGLKKPVVAVRQSFDPALRISDQRDYTVIERPLDCLPCNAYMCRIDKESPPCGLIDPGLVREALHNKLSGIFGHTVSAIIPVYKPDIARLNRCLTAILPQVNQVVIGIDGGLLAQDAIIRSPKIKFVSHFSKTRRGYGKTCNLAARESFGRFLLMLNDDCFAHPEMVRHMLIELEHDRTAVVGCLLRYPDGRIQHGGTVRRGLNFGHIDHLKTETTIKAACDLEWVTFASAIVRRDAFFELDGFDERFDCYAEDSDFCLRAGRAGWKIRYTPHASAIHQESQTTSPMKQQLLESGNRTLHSIWEGKL